LRSTRALQERLTDYYDAFEAVKYDAKVGRIGESVMDVVDLLSHMDEHVSEIIEEHPSNNVLGQAAQIYSAEFASLSHTARSDATLGEMEERVLKSLRAKRSARLMITVRTTHTHTREAWTRLLVAACAVIEDAGQRFEHLATLTREEQQAVAAHKRFEVYLSGLAECARLGMMVCASARESGLNLSKERNYLDACEVAQNSLLRCKHEDTRILADLPSLAALMQEAAIAAIAPDVLYCNLTLRPVAPVQSSRIDGVTYMTSAMELWRHLVAKELPQSEDAFS
jgi:hypothetical protein